MKKPILLSILLTSFFTANAAETAATEASLLAPAAPATQVFLSGTIPTGTSAASSHFATLSTGGRTLEFLLTATSNTQLELSLVVAEEASVFWQPLGDDNMEHTTFSFPLTLIRVGAHMEIPDTLASEGPRRSFRLVADYDAESDVHRDLCIVNFDNISLPTPDEAPVGVALEPRIQVENNGRAASAVTGLSFVDGRFVAIAADGRHITLPLLSVMPDAHRNALRLWPTLAPALENTPVINAAEPTEGNATASDTVDIS